MMACCLFFVDTLPLYIEHYLRMLNLFLPSIEISLSEGVFFVLLAILLLSAFKELAQWFVMKSLRSRKAFIVFCVSFICTFRFFTIAADGLQHLMVLAFPIAALVGNYLLFARKWWWYELLFALFLLSAIYFHLSQVFGL